VYPVGGEKVVPESVAEFDVEVVEGAFADAVFVTVYL
jgi:hypothetical protein